MKNKLMDKWNLIQDQPSLRETFEQPPLSLIEKENRLKKCLLKQNFKGCEQHNGYTAGVVQVCHPHFKRNLRYVIIIIYYSFCMS